MDTDQLIESALSGYTEATPRAGLEQRVLNRIQNAQAVRRGSRGLAVLSIGMAAAVLLFVTAGLRTSHTAVSSIRPKPAELATAPPAPPSTGIRSSAPKRRRHRIPVANPLSDEERALVALVEHQPADALQILAATEERNSELIEISPILIAPLSDDGGR